jgi:copper transport protein
LVFVGGAILAGIDSPLARERDFQRLLQASAVALAVGSALIAVARAAEAKGGSIWTGFTSVGQLVVETRVGVIDATRFALAVIVLAVALAPVGRAMVAALPAAATALLTWPLVGHAWSSSPQRVAVAVDAVHLVAVAVWVGGFAAVYSVRSAEERVLAKSTRQFSQMALVAAPVVVASGVWSTTRHLSRWSQFTSTTYGSLLLAKLVGVAIVLVLGAVHRHRLRAGIERLAVRLLEIEGLTMAVVLGLTAVLIGSAPPPRYERAPFAASVEHGNSVTKVRVAPGAAGTNTIEVWFVDPSGQPRRVDAAAVWVESASVPKRKVDMALDGSAARLATTEVTFATRGSWSITVESVTDAIRDSAEFNVEIQ